MKEWTPPTVEPLHIYHLIAKGNHMMCKDILFSIHANNEDVALINAYMLIDQNFFTIEKLPPMTSHPLQWFIDRIGKTVYRDAVVQLTHETTPMSIKINDKSMAYNLYRIQCSQYDGISYRDNP